MRPGKARRRAAGQAPRGLAVCKRRQNAFRKTVSYTPKGRLLHAERPQTAKHVLTPKIKTYGIIKIEIQSAVR